MNEPQAPGTLTPPMNEPFVQAEGIRRSFPTGDGSIEVLRGIDLVIRHRERLAVLGNSGVGKSTLLHILGTLERPTVGRVRFRDEDVFAKPSDQLARFRNATLGFVFQFHHLLPQCTALENVLLPTLVDSDSSRREAAVDRARSLLADIGLGERTNHRPAQLSGGECQRVAVVRALINEPRLLLADEPTGSLDAKSAEQLGELLCELNERRSVALVTVTHSQRLAGRMGRILELEDGQLWERPPVAGEPSS